MSTKCQPQQCHQAITLRNCPAKQNFCMLADLKVRTKSGKAPLMPVQIQSANLGCPSDNKPMCIGPHRLASSNSMGPSPILCHFLSFCCPHTSVHLHPPHPCRPGCLASGCGPRDSMYLLVCQRAGGQPHLQMPGPAPTLGRRPPK